MNTTLPVDTLHLGDITPVSAAHHGALAGPYGASAINVSAGTQREDVAASAIWVTARTGINVVAGAERDAVGLHDIDR